MVTEEQVQGFIHLYASLSTTSRSTTTPRSTTTSRSTNPPSREEKVRVQVVGVLGAIAQRSEPDVACLALISRLFQQVLLQSNDGQGEVEQQLEVLDAAFDIFADKAQLAQQQIFTSEGWLPMLKSLIGPFKTRVLTDY